MHTAITERNNIVYRDFCFTTIETNQLATEPKHVRLAVKISSVPFKDTKKKSKTKTSVIFEDFTEAEQNITFSHCYCCYLRPKSVGFGTALFTCW